MQISLVTSCTAVCREISLTVIIPLPLCSKIQTITNIFIFLWFEASTATEKICPFQPSFYLCSQLKEELIYSWQYTTLLSYHGIWLILLLKFGEGHKFAVTNKWLLWATVDTAATSSLSLPKCPVWCTFPHRKWGFLSSVRLQRFLGSVLFAAVSHEPTMSN